MVIYGAGGLGVEMLALLKRAGMKVDGFIDDKLSAGETICGVPVIGGADWLNKNHSEVLLAVGSPVTRRNIYDRIVNISGVKLSKPVTDPAAHFLDFEQIELGAGAMITAGVVLTTRIKIGLSVLVNLNTSIGHDTTIGDFATIMPGSNIAGNVRIGEGVLIGSGANILGGIAIGDGAVVGAGAVVTRDVPPGKTVVGIPARLIQRK